MSDGIQLTIDVPAERHVNDRYAEYYGYYLKHCPVKGVVESNVFFCYNFVTRQYFVSRFFSKQFILKYYPNTIKIIY